MMADLKRCARRGCNVRRSACTSLTRRHRLENSCSFAGGAARHSRSKGHADAKERCHIDHILYTLYACISRLLKVSRKRDITGIKIINITKIRRIPW